MADNLAVSVVRPEDLLVLKFEFVNLVRQEVNDPQLGKIPALVRQEAAKPALIVAYFPPQHIQEQTFHEAENPVESEKLPPTPVANRLSGPSRLVFTVPPQAAPIPYTLEAILEQCRRCELSLISPSTDENPYDATPPLTAIEFPFRLILSPSKSAAWVHADLPVRHGSHTELWHTRLAVRKPLISSPQPKIVIDEKDTQLRTVRAVHRRGPIHFGIPFDDPDSPSPIFLYDWDAMSESERDELIRLSVARPIQAETLMLSSLGAWAGLRGNWPNPVAGTSITDWDHRSTQGRDHYVKIVKAGFLMPFGHRAVWVEITERKFELNADGSGNTACLRKRQFVIVTEQEKSFRNTLSLWNNQKLDLQMPFEHVRLQTLVTPKLDKRKGDNFDWPMISNAKFLFQFIARGLTGKTVEFSLPVLFVEKGFVDNANNWKQIEQVYNSANNTTSLNGQSIAFAKQNASGDTSFDVKSLTWQIKYEGVVVNGQAPSLPLPVMKTAQLTLPAIKHLVGEEIQVPVKYHTGFLTNEWANNPGEVFLQAEKPALQAEKPAMLDFSQKGDKSGALVQPSMAINGLSRKYGLVGGNKETALGDFANGTFDPASFFEGADPMLLGAVPLSEIINKVTSVGDGKEIPKFTTAVTEIGMKASLAWNPKLKTLNKDFFVFDAAAATMSLLAEVSKETGKEPTSLAECKLENFALTLKVGNTELIKLDFKKLFFKAQSGAKPDVDVDFKNLEFLGPLKFIESLKHFIPLNGFSDPPALDISPQGITAGYSLSLPTVAIGVFSLQNVNLSAAFRIPFVKESISLELNFCQPHQRFLLTVGAFGGGGYVNLRLGPGGVEMLKGAFDFGGCVSMDFGVASGGVSVMASVLYEYSKEKGATFGGQLTIRGAVEVLGLVCVNITLVATVIYDHGKLIASGSIEVEIDLGLWSEDVSIEYSRQFAGSNGDPTFEQVMEPYWLEQGKVIRKSSGKPLPANTTKPWENYCKAFAFA
jgi:hypothetical protein